MDKDEKLLGPWSELRVGASECDEDPQGALAKLVQIGAVRASQEQ